MLLYVIYHSVPNTLSKFREDCPAFAGKTPFQDRVLRALNLSDTTPSLPSKLVEECIEKENNARVLFAASPPRTHLRKRGKEDDAIIQSLQSQITKLGKKLTEETDKLRKLQDSRIEELRRNKNEIMNLKKQMEGIRKTTLNIHTEWEKSKQQTAAAATCCVVQ